ncbi:MAG TPA: RNA polymerase factor sigma-54 [Terriglobales bacterium]|nr:RNA polymerase factor sigma-54 [Terriglobales bacterium]
MVLLQHKLSLKVSQKQILTPGLVQMVSVLALNKLELKDMINAEMVENPVLEELDPTVPLIDDVARNEEERDRQAQTTAAEETNPDFTKKSDPFEEIDFGSFFQEYLDPGYRTNSEIESVEKPSFENFLSKPGTLTDHLMWQLGASPVSDGVRMAAELVIGNLNEEGYLTATEDELMLQANPNAPISVPQASTKHNAGETPDASSEPAPLIVDDGELAERAGAELGLPDFQPIEEAVSTELEREFEGHAVAVAEHPPDVVEHLQEQPVVQEQIAAAKATTSAEIASAEISLFSREDLQEALKLIRQMDPVGVACPDLRGCLLEQLNYHKRIKQQAGETNGFMQTLDDAIAIVSDHLRLIQNKQMKEVAKAIGRPVEAVEAAMDYVRTLDPKPGLRYNIEEPRLIEPDVAFVKQGDEYLVLLNDDDVPQLRLNTSYKRLMNRDAAEKDVRSYVKERYKSAIQLIKNIEQRKQTILKVCYSIVARQRDFLDHGIDQLKPMMIKEVAEEIGVHPSTVSRAVANKYAHTAQGVFELRYFFSESVQGPEGGNTSLLILKRRVKKLIDEEDPTRPLTDEQITRILQSQGIQVTRRTVAKYREDMKIPSTHQRRVKKS